MVATSVGLSSANRQPPKSHGGAANPWQGAGTLQNGSGSKVLLGSWSREIFLLVAADICKDTLHPCAARAQDTGALPGRETR